jgi:hypothetical protein
MPRQFGQRASVVVSTHARSDSSLVNSWDAVLGHLRTGWFAQVSNGAAGLANPGAMGRTLGQGLRWLNGVQMRRPCFPGEVQVLTRRGWVRWDGLRAGDEVLSLPEDEPEGESAYRPVEEVFQRWGVIWEVAVGGRVLRTTAEHPFWVRGRGWTAARQLRGAMRCGRTTCSGWPLRAVRDTGRAEAVYNGRVAEYHTYFVG